MSYRAFKMSIIRTRQTFTMYTLEKPDWLHSSGISKGIHHDKQALGVILDAGTSIRLKHLAASQELTLQIELLNDDENTEQYAPITSQFSEVIIAHQSTPFISTPYTATPSTIDIEIEFSSTPGILPIFRRNEDPTNFFRLWTEHQSAFALIITEYADILVPAKDRPTLERLHEGSGLASIDAYYTGIFEYFNTLAGLSFSPEHATNKNIPNRYFMKANKSGSGSAYYGGSHTAECTDSVAAFWLDTRPQNWGAVHEIGHGYQGHFMQHSTLHLGEVWNNVYAHYYQQKNLGEDIFRLGWLYNGNPEALFNSVEQLFNNNQPVNTWQLGQILFYVSIMLDRSGESAFIDFNENYRLLSNQENFSPKDHPFLDLWSASLAKKADIDISPLLALGKTPLSPAQELHLRYANHKPVYPLYKLVKKEQLDRIIQDLGLMSRLALVDSYKLKRTTLTGTIEILLEEDLFFELQNLPLLLRTGTNLSYIAHIDAQLITFQDIPIGVYTLQPPSSANGSLKFSTQHVEAVAGATNQIKLNHTRRTGVELATQTISLLGLNGRFASIEINTGHNYIHIDISAKQPHSYFQGRTYTAIEIKDRNQNIIYHKNLLGDNEIALSEIIPYGPAYTLEIFHEEPSRNYITPNSSSVLDATEKTIVLELTRQGLNNKNLQTPIEENLEAEIEKIATAFRSETHLFLHEHHPHKDNISTAIDSFIPPKKNLLEEKYKDIFLLTLNTSPTIITGQKFSWDQLGLGGTAIQIELDLESETIQINIPAKSPHSYISTIYIALWIYDETNRLLLCQELRGNSIAEPFSDTLPFHEGYRVAAMHLEPSRSPITNLSTGEKYNVLERHCVLALGQNRLQI